RGAARFRQRQRDTLDGVLDHIALALDTDAVDGHRGVTGLYFRGRIQRQGATESAIGLDSGHRRTLAALLRRPHQPPGPVAAVIHQRRLHALAGVIDGVTNIFQRAVISVDIDTERVTVAERKADTAATEPGLFIGDACGGDAVTLR